MPALEITSLAIEPIAAKSINLPWPAKGQAAIGSLEEGFLAASAKNEKVKPIASMAKIITALAVLQKKPFQLGEQGETIELDSTDAGYYQEFVNKGGSVAPVKAGQKLTQFDALQALLLPSANNIADSLARWAFGSMKAYKRYAGSMLKTYGLVKTKVDDASGFSPRTVSTPSEMLVIAQRAMQQPVISKIVAKKTASIPVTGKLTNVNRLLSDKVVGIKTGTTDQAGGCLLFAAKHSVAGNSLTIIGVVMGTPNPNAAFAGASRLIKAAERGFAKRTLLTNNSIIGRISAKWSRPSDIVTKGTLTTYGWLGKVAAPGIKIDEIKPPLLAGQVMGKMVNDTGVAASAVPIVASQEISPPSVWWRLTHYF